MTGPWKGMVVVRRAGKHRIACIALYCIVALASCSRSIPPPESPGAIPSHFPEAMAQVGTASWYGPGFHGRATTSGEIYDMYQLTAAHPSLPMGTVAQVTNLENDRTVQVKINDRGPFVKGRIVDLSYAAARILGMVETGTSRVRLQIVRGPGEALLGTFPLTPHYVLQLGAFTQRENALALEADLKCMAGESGVNVVLAQIGSQDIFRVRFGRFERREEAEAKAKELARKGYMVLVLEEYE